MAAADFGDLYTQTCELLQLRPGTLEVDARGARTFTIAWRGAQMSFTDRPRPQGDCVSIAMRFGPLPEEQKEEIVSNLMRSSFLMMANGSAFVMSPTTGDIYLHHLSPLASFHVQGLRAMLDGFADQLANWSSTYFLETDKSSRASGFGMTAFA